MSDAKLHRLLKLLEVERDARQARTRAILGYHMVTRSREIIPYMQAAFLSVSPQSKITVESLSDVAVPDQSGPFCLWLKAVVQYLVKERQIHGPEEINPQNLPDDLRNQWADWAPERVMGVPLLCSNEQLVGFLWLTRDEAWVENEIVLLERLGDCYAHAWAALNVRTKLWGKVNKKVLAGVFGVILLLGLFPVRQSALAPAEVVPKDPLVISAPLEGVVAEIAVSPYQEVTTGQVLVRFDETVLKNQVAIALEALEVTKAELQTTRQSAFHSLDSQSKLALLEAQVGLRRAELVYAESLLERGIILAPRDGVVVFRDVNDWTGRPTRTGEKIMLLADPDQTELKIDLPVSDAIALEVGAEVRLFLDVDPLSAYEAALSRTSYEASLSENAQDLNFQLMADFEETETPPRIGLRGTAKLYGETTVLGLYIFRKPLAGLRQWMGV